MRQADGWPGRSGEFPGALLSARPLRGYHCDVARRLCICATRQRWATKVSHQEGRPPIAAWPSFGPRVSPQDRTGPWEPRADQTVSFRRLLICASPTAALTLDVAALTAS